MLAVGNIMNQGTRNGRAVGFTLDSMLKMVHTKGVDKKTTVLDYVVKSLLDKEDGEGTITNLIEDLGNVEMTARVGSNRDLLDDLTSVLRNYEDLQGEYRKIKEYVDKHTSSFTTSTTTSTTSPAGGETNTDNTNTYNTENKVSAIDLAYKKHLNVYIQRYHDRVSELSHTKTTLSNKIKSIIEYFGEDTNTCEVSKVFATMLEFRRAVMASRDMIAKRAKAAKQASFRK